MVQTLVSIAFAVLLVEPAPADPAATPAPEASAVAGAWTADRTLGLAPVEEVALEVAVVHAEDGSVETVATVELPSPPAGLAVAADTGLGVAVAPGGEGGVAWVRLADGEVVGRFPSAAELSCSRCVAVSADGRRAVVAGAAERAEAVTVLGGGPSPFIVDEVSLAAVPKRVEISPDQRFAVVHSADGMVTVLRLHDGGVVGSYRE